MSDKKELLNVIVPCLNEEGNIRATVTSIMAVVPELDVDVQLHLVDDGSTDGTLKQMHILAEEFGCIVHSNPRNLGLGRTVMQTWEKLPADSWCTVMPGDNEIYFDSIHAFLEVRDQFDVILGYVHNPVVRTLPRRIGSSAFMRVANALFGFRHKYLNGMKMYRVSAFHDIAVKSSGHAFNAELLAKALLRDPHLRIGEVPFVWRGRAEGASKAFQPKSIWRAMREVFQGLGEVSRYREEVLRNQSND